MALKDVFIANLKKIRKQRKLSQMKLAERCNTAASYIGEIEIGRKFPSVQMIENMAGVLGIEAYRLFVDDSLANADNEKAAAYFAKMPPGLQRFLVNRIMNAVTDGLDTALNLKDVISPQSAKRPSKTKNVTR